MYEGSGCSVYSVSTAFSVLVVLMVIYFYLLVVCLAFPQSLMKQSTFFMCLLEHLDILFCEVPIQDIFQKNEIVCFSYLSIEMLYIFWHKSFVRYCQ